MQRGSGAAVSAAGQGAFEPAFQRDPVFFEVPDTGEPMILEGPMSVNEFLYAININTNWNILVSEAAQAKQLQFWIVDTPPRGALEVLKFHDIYYEFDEDSNFLRVMTVEEHLEREYGMVRPHQFKVQYADITYIESIISSLLSSLGRMITDQRTGNIYVWDMEDNLEQMIKTVGELDVPLQKTEFLVRHADLGDIEGVLGAMLSPNGSLLADARTGQVFVWDGPSTLDRMRLAVDRLDVPVASHTFEIQHINAEDMIDSLEVLMSERGLIQVDPRYNALVITDLPSHIEKMEKMIETLDRELETRTWVVKYADLRFLADQIEMHVPAEMGEIVLNEEVHQITITGLPSRLDKIDELINTWDIRRRQVDIQAFIVEMGDEVEREFNINWSYHTSSQGAPIVVHGAQGAGGLAEPRGSGQALSLGQLPYAIPAYGRPQLDSAGNITRPLLTNIDGQTIIDRFGGNRLALTLNYLDQENKATILSSPRVTVQDGEEATFENATRVPFVSATTMFRDTVPGFGSTTGRIEFIDVGTILRVLPRVTEDMNILLDISAEDSTFEDKVIVASDQTSTVPQKTVRRAQTQLRVNDGDTIVLGGLRRDRTAHQVSKTPFLGDLPLVGRIFRNPSRTTENRALMIFITTTIVGEETQPEARILSRAEDDIARDLRRAKKPFWERMTDRIADGKNEISLSIGQSGVIHSEGNPVTLEELHEIFFELNVPSSVTLVIRRHPAAPAEVVTEVTELAMVAGLRVDFDDAMVPIVPNYGEPAI